MSAMFDAIDLYCERTGPEFWSEPVNALTNIFFLLAAWFCWRRARSLQVLSPGVWLLITLLAAIGIGSFLFHTFANGWSLVADLVPIFFFQLAFLWLYLREVAMAGRWFSSACLAGLFISVYIAEQFSHLMNGSLGYVPALAIVFLLGIYHYIRHKKEPTALLASTAVLILSLTFRTIDHSFCETIPIGTHFLWHTLNAVALYLVMRGYLVNRKLAGIF